MFSGVYNLWCQTTLWPSDASSPLSHKKFRPFETWSISSCNLQNGVEKLVWVFADVCDLWCQTIFDPQMDQAYYLIKSFWCLETWSIIFHTLKNGGTRLVLLLLQHTTSSIRPLLTPIWTKPTTQQKIPSVSRLVGRKLLGCLSWYKISSPNHPWPPDIPSCKKFLVFQNLVHHLQKPSKWWGETCFHVFFSMGHSVPDHPQSPGVLSWSPYKKISNLLKLI